jgi:hypothetical protein
MTKDEIAYKITQALLVLKEKGGPKSMPVAYAAKIAAQKNPNITESDIKAIVQTSKSLDLNGEDIILSKQFIDLLS